VETEQALGIKVNLVRLSPGLVYNRAVKEVAICSARVLRSLPMTLASSVLSQLALVLGGAGARLLRVALP
jgi:hypothetical protein